jgi:hypothetical protein
VKNLVIEGDAMDNQIKIKVSNLTGSSLCISTEDGQKVYAAIEQQIKAGKRVNISFEGVTKTIALFFNVAIGQLYEHFSEKTILAQVTVDGLSSDDMELLKCAVDNAKKYLSNKKSYDDAWMKLEKNMEDFYINDFYYKTLFIENNEKCFHFYRNDSMRFSFILNSNDGRLYKFGLFAYNANTTKYYLYCDFVIDCNNHNEIIIPIDVYTDDFNEVLFKLNEYLDEDDWFMSIEERTKQYEEEIENLDKK